MWNEESRVRVYPFTRQPDGEEIVVGRLETSTYLSLSEDAVLMLDTLQGGATVGEAQSVYEAHFGERPDLTEFLELMEEKGFVAPWSNEENGAASEPGLPPATGWSRWLSQPAAAALTSWPLIGIALGVVMAALYALLRDPALIPGPRAAYFPDDRSVKLIVVVALLYASTYVHELGHLVAARALGLRPTIGFGHRMWILVLETDITGLWAVPKKKRVFPILAGGLVDLVLVSGLLLFVGASRHGYLTVSPNTEEVAWALSYLLFLRIVWQFFFFMRTDLYFLVAHIFGCKNLMADTEELLKAKARVLLPRLQARSLDDLPSRELRVVRGFAVLWVLGRVIALYALIFLTLPVVVLYVQNLWIDLSAGAAGNTYRFVDSLIVTVLYLVPFCAGMFLWLRSLRRGWKETVWMGRV